MKIELKSLKCLLRFFNKNPEQNACADSPDLIVRERERERVIRKLKLFIITIATTTIIKIKINLGFRAASSNEMRNLLT